MARRSSALGLRAPVSGLRERDEVGRKLMRADDPVAPLLEQPHGAAQDLVVAARDDFACTSLPVAQQRIGAEKRREARAGARRRRG